MKTTHLPQLAFRFLAVMGFVPICITASPTRSAITWYTQTPVGVITAWSTLEDAPLVSVSTSRPLTSSIPRRLLTPLLRVPSRVVCPNPPLRHCCSPAQDYSHCD